MWLQAMDQAQHMAGVECFEKVHYTSPSWAAATILEQQYHLASAEAPCYCD